MGTEHFSLCWNNFHSNLSSGFHSLFQGEHFVDVTLAAEGKMLKAHKMVLSVCSPYFNKLFRGNPCKHPIVFLKDVSASALDQLLTFMYKGEVSVRQDELSTFIKTAEALQIKGLSSNIEESFSTTLSQQSQVNGENAYLEALKRLSKESQYMPLKRRHKSTNNTSISNKLNPEGNPQNVSFIPNNPGTSQSSKNSRLSVEPLDDIGNPSSAKRSCASSLTSSDKDDSCLTEKVKFTEPIVPKQEPIDDDDDDYNDTSFSNDTNFDDSLDASALLETKVSVGPDFNLEQSSSSSATTMSQSIKPKGLAVGNENLSQGMSGLSGQPLRFMTSGRGLPVLVYAGHMYTLEEQRSHKTTWVCVKRRRLNCQGCVTTSSPPQQISTSAPSSPGSTSSFSSKGKFRKEQSEKYFSVPLNTPKILSYCGHNHSHLNDIIERIQAKDCISVTPKS